MKFKFKAFKQKFKDGFLHMLRRYPVESILILLGTVGCILSYELYDERPIITLVVPLAFVAALSVNLLAGQSAWRKIYWVSWAPFVPLLFWGGLEAWEESQSGVITYFILLPLALLLCGLAIANKRFVDQLVIWFRSGVLAWFVANIALGMFAAIFFSTVYIFDFSGAWIEDVWVYAIIIFEVLVGPVLFLMLHESWRGGELLGNRLFDVLLNYIITPSLLIYAAILYLYMVKIVVLWTLPNGGVAYLVFGFTMVALAVKAAQFMLQKRLFDWFFNRFSLISLPMQVLFWVGVMRRVNEYGLTEPRVYLLVCGGIMTLCVLLFLSNRIGRYYYVCAACFVAFTTLAFVPSLSPERIAIRSQVNRVVRIAAKLDLLSENGKIKVFAIKPDSLLKADYRGLSDAYFYASIRDSAVVKRFGVPYGKLEDAIRDATGNSCYDEVCYIFSGPRLDWPYNITIPEGYKNLYLLLNRYRDDKYPCYDEDRDSLRVNFGDIRPSFHIAKSDLVQRLYKNANLEDDATDDELRQHTSEFLTYRDEDMIIIFQYMNVIRDSSKLSLEGIEILAILTR